MVSLKGLNAERRTVAQPSSPLDFLWNIIPREMRNSAVLKFVGLRKLLWKGLVWSGGWIWILTTTMLILVFPAKRAIDIEQGYMEQEYAQSISSGSPNGQVPVIPEPQHN